MTMSKTRQILISLNTWCYVANYFAIFINDVNRGPNFTWAEFPNMAKDYCETTMWVATGLSSCSRNKKKELEFIAKISIEIAETLIKKAGLDD